MNIEFQTVDNTFYSRLEKPESKNARPTQGNWKFLLTLFCFALEDACLKALLVIITVQKIPVTTVKT